METVYASVSLKFSQIMWTGEFNTAHFQNFRKFPTLHICMSVVDVAKPNSVLTMAKNL